MISNIFLNYFSLIYDRHFLRILKSQINYKYFFNISLIVKKKTILLPKLLDIQIFHIFQDIQQTILCTERNQFYFYFHSLSDNSFKYEECRVKMAKHTKSNFHLKICTEN